MNQMVKDVIFWIGGCLLMSQTAMAKSDPYLVGAICVFVAVWIYVPARDEE